MNAIGFKESGGEEKLMQCRIEKPKIGDLDLLIKVHAFALNPVDTKIREGQTWAPVPSGFKVLGWDGSGVVEQVGKQVKDFKVGDEVFWTGNYTRNGCNAEYAAVDCRVAALKPKSVNHLEASSMPLTALTAWEALETQMGIPIPHDETTQQMNAKKSLLVVAGAGGVGSIAIQLAKKVFKLGRVIATAGREDSMAWVESMGADVVLDRTRDWAQQLGIKKDSNEGLVDYILACHEVDDCVEKLVSICRPFGHICCIVPLIDKPMNITEGFMKSITFSWENMGARSFYNEHPQLQGVILKRIASLVDEHVIRPWLGKTYEKATTDNLKDAHQLQASGKAIGKIAFKAEFDPVH